MKLKRILVALDASPHSIAALETAAILALQNETELIGIFVEDSDLLRLAELPFARELMYPNILGRRLDSEKMSVRLKQIAHQAREALSEIAGRASLQWSFKIKRGSVLHEIIAAADESDLLILGKAGHTGKQRFVRLGRTASHLLLRSTIPTLVMQHGTVAAGCPALIVCDGSQTCLDDLPRVLDAALLFSNDPLFLLLAKSRAEAESIRQQIENRLSQPNLRFRRCSPTEKDGIVRIAHEENCCIIILVGRTLNIQPEELPEMFAQISCPVLVYR